MPHGSLHKIKGKRNWAILAAIAAFIALVWIITMVKVGSGS